MVCHGDFFAVRNTRKHVLGHVFVGVCFRLSSLSSNVWWSYLSDTAIDQIAKHIQAALVTRFNARRAHLGLCSYTYYFVDFVVL